MIDQRNKLIEEIKSVSLTDELTGLMNRRGFNNVSNYELARLGRSQKGYTVVICDIDHFKFVIDNFGHTCGDLVIKRFADILETNMRRGDTAARLGGEEFVVFLPETNKREAEIVLERIRKETGHQAVECKNESFTRTMSFVACFCDNPGIKIDTILSIADRNPYLAKESGRNRVVITIIRAVSR